jgi:predicted secreted protein
MMSIISAIVLFAVIWFMVFFIAIPLRLKTQGDVGEIVPGTHAGAPAEHQLKKKAWITTFVAFVLWVGFVAVIVSGKLTVRDLDMFNRMGPATVGETDG